MNPQFLKCVLIAGPALIFEYKPKTPFNFFPRAPEYYWKYRDQETLYGAFDSFSKAITHCEACMIASGRMDSPITQNVIHVDFKTKRRIS